MTECKGSRRALFKGYNQNQQMLLPPDLEELIPQEHLVRVVNDTIDKMDIEPLIKSYKGGGTTSYYPKMLLKVLVYGYICKIYSCRKLAKALRENVYFMWLAAQNRPDFRTINNFRSGRLRSTIEEIFASLLAHLIDLGYVKLEHYFVDGTKLRADANKYSWVWAKNTERYQAQLQQKIKELLKEIDATNAAEDEEYGDQDLEEMGEDSAISSERLQEIVDDINKKLADNPKDRKLKSAQRKISKDFQPRLKKYEDQKHDLAGRNSCSKTDKDATFFRFKNGELLPAYNVLAGTENQFILNWSIHQHPTDTVSFIPHLDKLTRLTPNLPRACMGDSGFGSEENYDYLHKQDIDNYLKYNTFHQELKGKPPKNRFHKNNFTYDENDDSFLCPEGRRLRFTETQERKTANGYMSQCDIYVCEDCSGCAFAAECKKTDGPRTLSRNPRLDAYRHEAMENLTSPEGIDLRKRRGVDVESVFGHIKHNMGYRRFRLRGLPKVNIEMGLLSMAHNMIKVFNQNQPTLQPAC
jgi:transposase